MNTEIIYTDNILKILGSITIYDSEEIAQLLREFCSPDKPSPQMLDLSGLTELDSAGIQILLALRKQHPELRVHSCPANQRELLERVGLLKAIL